MRQFFERRSVAVLVLYAIQFSLLAGLVIAAGEQQVLTKEEASTAFVDTSFLLFRLQHHIFNTNFYSYVFYALAHHLVHGLFYARWAKIAIMALLPGTVSLYLRDRLCFRPAEAFAGGLATGLITGALCMSWIGIEYGLDCVFGLFAMWLAIREDRAAILLSGPLAAFAAGCYGPGLVFLMIVVLHQVVRLRDRNLRTTALASLGLAATVILFPVFWWTNIQSLYTGGAGRPTLAGAPHRLLSLLTELFLSSDSYYFFSNGRPAVGLFLLPLACAGAVVSAVRFPRRAWPLFFLTGATVTMYLCAAKVTGVRRTLPLMLALAMFAIIFLHALLHTQRRWARPVVVGSYGLWLASGALQYTGIRHELASSTIALPHDFEFHIPAGSTMTETVQALVNGSRKLPPDLAGYEPDRTLAILYFCSLPRPIISKEQLIGACDRHGWSIASSTPPFSYVRAQALR